jgi:hypothetical protein
VIGNKVFGRVFVPKKAKLSQQFVLMHNKEHVVYVGHLVFGQWNDEMCDLYSTSGDSNIESNGLDV